jgi:hypothetical protein
MLSAWLSRATSEAAEALTFGGANTKSVFGCFPRNWRSCRASRSATASPLPRCCDEPCSVSLSNRHQPSAQPPSETSRGRVRDESDSRERFASRSCETVAGMSRSHTVVVLSPGCLLRGWIVGTRARRELCLNRRCQPFDVFPPRMTVKRGPVLRSTLCSIPSPRGIPQLSWPDVRAVGSRRQAGSLRENESSRPRPTTQRRRLAHRPPQTVAVVLAHLPSETRHQEAVPDETSDARPRGA